MKPTMCFRWRVNNNDSDPIADYLYCGAVARQMPILEQLWTSCGMGDDEGDPGYYTKARKCEWRAVVTVRE